MSTSSRGRVIEEGNLSSNNDEFTCLRMNQHTSFNTEKDFLCETDGTLLNHSVDTIEILRPSTSSLVKFDTNEQDKAHVLNKNPIRNTEVENKIETHRIATHRVTQQQEPIPSSLTRSPRRNKNTASGTCTTSITSTTTPLWDDHLNLSNGNNKSKQRRRHEYRRSISYCTGDTCSIGSCIDLDNTHSISAPSRITELLLPNATIQRNSSTSSSTSSSSTLSESVMSTILTDENGSIVEQQQPVQPIQDDPLFFSPRRRINSTTIHTTTASTTTPTIPVPISISYGNLSDISVDDQIHSDLDDILESDTGSIHYKNSNVYDAVTTSNSYSDNNNIQSMFLLRHIHRCFITTTTTSTNKKLSLSLPIITTTPTTTHTTSQQKQRRNLLLLLFMVATYTTFGLASPHLSMVSKSDDSNSNIIIIDDTIVNVDIDVPTKVVDEPMYDIMESVSSNQDEPTTVVSNMIVSSSSSSSSLRGTTSTSRTTLENPKNYRPLSFARDGNTNQHRPLIFRRKEVNDFYHQSAFIEEDTVTYNSWYMNCIVLIMIAIYYIIRDRTYLLLCRHSTTTTTASHRNNSNIIISTNNSHLQ